MAKPKSKRSVAVAGDWPLVPVTELQRHPRNVRQGDIGAICESIRHNGFYRPIVVQRATGYVLAGNHALAAAVECGIEAVPVAWVDCDDQQALNILLVDNRTNDLASYDNPALADLLQSILGDQGTLAGTGYDGDFLDELLADLGTAQTGELLAEESQSSTGTSLIAKLQIPPRAWLTMRADIQQAVDSTAQEYGLMVTWPE